MAVVHLDDGTGYAIRGRRGQEEQGGIHLRRVADPPAREVLAEIPDALEHAFHHFRGECAGGDHAVVAMAFCTALSGGQVVGIGTFPLLPIYSGDTPTFQAGDVVIQIT